MPDGVEPQASGGDALGGARGNGVGGAATGEEMIATRATPVPQAGAYLIHSNALLAMGQQTLQALHRRLGETDWVHRYHAVGGEVFARVTGGQGRYQNDLSAAQFGFDYAQDWRGLQVGTNWRVIDADDHSVRLGLALCSARAQVSPRAVYAADAVIGPVPIEVSRHRTDASALLATMTWQRVGGGYVEGAIGGSRYRSDVTTSFRQGRLARLASSDVLASIEGGYAWRLSERLTLQPQAQVAWQELRTSPTKDADGVDVDIEHVESLVWRVGARALLAVPEDARGILVTKYFAMNYADSGGPTAHVNLSGSRFESGAYGRLAELAYGLTVQPRRALSLYGDIALQGRVGRAGRDGWALSVGGKWAF